MERTLIREAKKNIGEVVTLKGFVQTVRNQKAVQFIILRDHTGLIQVVAERSEGNNTFNELIETLTRRVHHRSKWSGRQQSRRETRSDRAAATIASG